MEEQQEAYGREFGGRLRWLRQAHSMSQHDLAKMLGMRTMSIDMIERGKQVAFYPWQLVLLADSWGTSEMLHLLMSAPYAKDGIAERRRGKFDRICDRLESRIKDETLLINALDLSAQRSESAVRKALILKERDGRIADRTFLQSRLDQIRLEGVIE
ncbi:MAG: helix-turn-helix domain-containing protein [Acidobacteria bacterium]|nr:helix-turn-helix domain-containing protein [Acidobacteriota bacterium]